MSTTELRTRRIAVEDRDGVTIVRFLNSHIIERGWIDEAGIELFGLVGRSNKVVLDFGGVDFLASPMLPKMMTLEKRLREQHAKLRLCSIRPEIFEVFRITKLDQLFDIRDSLEEALASF